MMMVVTALSICFFIGCGVQSVGPGDETGPKGDTTEKITDSVDKTEDEKEPIRKDQPMKIRIGIMHPVTPSIWRRSETILQRSV